LLAAHPGEKVWEYSLVISRCIDLAKVEEASVGSPADHKLVSAWDQVQAGGGGEGTIESQYLKCSATIM